MAFWTSFLPETRRRLLKDGIHLEKIRYWSDVLARDLGRSGDMLIKYDPRDLSRIFVRRPDGSYIEARYRNLAYPAVTIWEWRNAKRRLFDQGKRDLDEDAIFSALALQRRIEDDAVATQHCGTSQSGKAATRDEGTEHGDPSICRGLTLRSNIPARTTWSFGNEFGSSSSRASGCGALNDDG